jgi:hypothetical protein
MDFGALETGFETGHVWQSLRRSQLSRPCQVRGFFFFFFFSIDLV